jgi:hypothetical protein
MVDPDTHPAGIRRQTIDAIRCHLAEFLVDKIMYFNLIGTARGAVVAATVPVFADQFLFLRIN